MTNTPSGHTKLVNLHPAAIESTGTITTAVLDATGFSHVALILHNSTVGASDAIDTAKVQSSATSGGTYADITGAVWADRAPADDDKISAVEIDCHRNHSFFKVLFDVTNVSTAMVTGVVAVLFNPDDGGVDLVAADYEAHA